MNPASENDTITSFVYDGDGNRVKKIVNDGQTVTTTIYVNKYYEVTGTEAISYYYHGGTMVAQREGTSLQYVHQDHLSSTSLMTNASGSQAGSTIKYRPFGETLAGSAPTDKLFTGQHLDDVTGLYFYNARYYDPTIGRFISPDTIMQPIFPPPLKNNAAPKGAAQLFCVLWTG